MTQRKFERYRISDYIREAIQGEGPELELHLDSGAMGGAVTDISVQGAGFRMENAGDAALDALKSGESLMVKVTFRGECIYANARAAWAARVEERGASVLRGGLQFTVMSAEDTRKLASIIGRIRKR